MKKYLLLFLPALVYAGSSAYAFTFQNTDHNNSYKVTQTVGQNGWNCGFMGECFSKTLDKAASNPGICGSNNSGCNCTLKPDACLTFKIQAKGFPSYCNITIPASAYVEINANWFNDCSPKPAGNCTMYNLSAYQYCQKQNGPS